MVFDSPDNIIKPIFHKKMRSRWLPNANEIDTSTWNLHGQCQYPTQIPNANYIPLASIGTPIGCVGICVGCSGIRVGRARVLDTQNLRIWGLDQRKAQMRVVSRCSGICLRLSFCMYRCAVDVTRHMTGGLNGDHLSI